MIIEIENKKEIPWITFTAENLSDWGKLTKLRDGIFCFETDDCYAEYQVPMNFDQKTRQFSIMLDIHCIDDEIKNWEE